MKNMLFLLLFCSVVSVTSEVNAAESDCFELAGQDARIEPDLLRAIAWHESRLNTKAIGDNALAGFSPGFGIGLMQIDSQHLGFLSQYGLDSKNLSADICLNIYAGAYFLAIAFNRLGDSWEAVGAYNAGFSKSPAQEKRRRDYIRRIKLSYKEIKLTAIHRGR
ncbi:transglycosylase SLT domain-containing protein [Citrobacter meridianamericanus]|uniref:transglycosylase SLT domain-containing protein n=1 Tax=Citrobacter meridianamericanus TaxID=2894201 RepID=UPI00351D1BCE